MSAGTVFALALGVGVLAQALGSLLRIPSIVPLFGAGLLLGPTGSAGSSRVRSARGSSRWSRSRSR